MPATAVHTSAHAAEPDMFGFDLATPEGDRTVEYLLLRGRVVQDAVVHIKPVGAGGHAMPVLCVELDYAGPGQQTMHVEQIYTPATRSSAEGLAARLRKGVIVTVMHPPSCMRLVLPHAQSITVEQPAH